MKKTKQFWDKGLNPITMKKEVYWYRQFTDEDLVPSKEDEVNQRVYNKLKEKADKPKIYKIELTPKQRYELSNGKIN